MHENIDMKQAATQSLQRQGEGSKLPITKQTTLAVVKGFLNSDITKKRFEEVLKDKAPGFMASITSLISSSQNFDGVDPATIISSALIAATLDLPINQNLGFAYLVPYAGKCQFQMSWRGFVQLALRTNQYRLLNATEVYEGELISRNRITGEILLDESQKSSDNIIGYVAFFRLVNGFEKTLFMTKEEVEKHAKRYSQTYKSSKDYVRNQSKWTTDFDAMALKTVIKLLLSKYGILSTEMRTAMQADQAVIKEMKDGEPEYEYPDNTEEAEVIDEETGEIKQQTGDLPFQEDQPKTETKKTKKA